MKNEASASGSKSSTSKTSTRRPAKTTKIAKK
jgi:hypothetical protein